MPTCVSDHFIAIHVQQEDLAARDVILEADVGDNGASSTGHYALMVAVAKIPVSDARGRRRVEDIVIALVQHPVQCNPRLRLCNSNAK